MTGDELDAVKVSDLCVIGEPAEITVDELQASGPPSGSLDEMNVAWAGAFLREHGYAVVELERCRISGEQFKKDMEAAGAGLWTALLGDSGTAEITTVSGEGKLGLANLHYVVSSKSCWPEKPRVQEDGFTGSALWQHDTREVGLWCFSYETTDIDPKCSRTLMEALVER